MGGNEYKLWGEELYNPIMKNKIKVENRTSRSTGDFAADQGTVAGAQMRLKIEIPMIACSYDLLDVWNSLAHLFI